MTSLIFRSGMTTIGGTVIELIADDTRLIFDFGTVFDPGTDVEVKPNVQGIYDQTSEFNDYVLISHLHLDHTKAINLVPTNVPIYMEKDSVTMLKCLKEVGFDQILGQWRAYSELEDKTKLGNFQVTSFLVDHDVPGACAFLIENEDLTLVYTGDIRMHGNKFEKTLEFITKCKQIEVDVLICEGVTISFIDDDYQIIPSPEVVEKESELVEKLTQNLNLDKPLFFNSYIMGIERLESFSTLAKRTGRKLVLTPQSAFLASKYGVTENVYVLDVDTNSSGFPIVPIDTLTNEHICQFTYENFASYRQVISGCQLVMCGGEPLGDYDPRFNVFLNDLNELGVEVLFEGVGGHASPENLQYIVDEIQAKILIPLHSFKPQLLKSAYSRQILPTNDQELVFNNHKLEE